MAIDRASLREMADRARSRMAAFREREKENISAAVAVIEINGASFAAGYLHGRKGLMPTLMGVPYDALGALLGYVFAFSGMAGKAKEHALNLGHGFGAYYSGNLGAQLGQRMRKETPEWKGAAWTDDEAKKLGGQVRTIVGVPQLQGHYAPNVYAGQSAARVGGWY